VAEPLRQKVFLEGVNACVGNEDIACLGRCFNLCRESFVYDKMDIPCCRIITATRDIFYHKMKTMPVFQPLLDAASGTVGIYFIKKYKEFFGLRDFSFAAE